MVQVSIVGPGGGETIPLGPAVQMRILENGSTTQHRLGLAESTLAPHTAGPAQHRHAQHDEGFYVVSGTVRFTIGDQDHDAGPGTLVMVPTGAPHTFANPGHEPAVLLTAFTPDLYVQYFRDLRDMAAAGQPTSSDTDALMARYATEPSAEYAPRPRATPTRPADSPRVASRNSMAPDGDQGRLHQRGPSAQPGQGDLDRAAAALVGDRQHRVDHGGPLCGPFHGVVATFTRIHRRDSAPALLILVFGGVGCRARVTHRSSRHFHVVSGCGRVAGWSGRRWTAVDRGLRRTGRASRRAMASWPVIAAVGGVLRQPVGLRR